MTTFTQLLARLKNFLRGWLLVLGLKEGMVEYATLCVKSEVILEHTQIDQCLGFSNNKTLINVSIAKYMFLYLANGIPEINSEF